MRRRLVLVLALLSCALPATAGDYRRSYLDGVKALERGQWAEAARLLGAAVAERPQEQARARLVGAIPEPYLPHHYLGVAYFNQQQCEQALAHWEISERQGAVRSLADLVAQARRGRATCEARLATPTDAEKAPEAPGPEVAGPEVAARDQPARPEPAAGDPAPSPPATPPTETPVGSVPEPAAASPATASPAPISTSRKPPLPAGVLEAAQAYFDGDYRRAVELLERPAPGAAERARFYSALFRSAARHALFLLGGETESDLLAAAVEDLREARRLNSSFAPHPDAFSPRYVELFRENP